MIIHGEFYDGIVGKPDLDDALEHYGVLGMKWGVRKDPERAYAKAQKKHDKYTKKIEKTNKKYLKEAGKVTRLIGRKKALKKVVRLNAKNDYLVNKQKKWDEQVEKVFSEAKNSKKEPKDRLVWSYDILMKDLKTGRRELSKNDRKKLAAYTLSPYTQAIPGLAEWVMKKDPNLEKVNPLKPEDTAKRYRQAMLKKK